MNANNLSDSCTLTPFPRFPDGKDFYFSHNPWNASILGGPNNYFEKEVLRLIELGAKDFVELPGGLWKAVR